MMASEKPKLSVEQVVAGLVRTAELYRKGKENAEDIAPTHRALDDAFIKTALDSIDQLPRVDVVEGCCKAHDEAYGMDRCGDPRTWMRAALRRYLELRGLPADPDLEGR